MWSGHTLSWNTPLDMRIKEAAALYEARTGRSVDSDEEEIESRTPYHKLPHPSDRPAIKYTDAETPVQTAIYTDGSKTPNGVGAAWVYIREGVEVKKKKIKLASYCTVYQAELAALRSATEYARTLKGEEVNIYSDSKASLEAITHSRSCNPQVVKIRRAIGEAEKRGQKINLHWLKAHIGTPGNERADELAKEAAEKLKTKPEYDKRPLSEVKRKIRERTLEAWQTRYTHSQTGAKTKEFLPDIKVAYKTVKDKMFEEHTVQVITGHGAFAEYLHRFKLKDDAACPCDQITPQTSTHMLLECPIMGLSRYDFEIQTGKTMTSAEMPTILKDSRLQLERFCKEIVRKTRKMNGSGSGSRDVQPTVARP
ncbi:unnamed protein product [Pieris macdunnoughi]|uniref:RNase H type-1 domain-containing protein n=1 Tax=Pieris macdunnoughi TaxID=345717 RepID=A0A821X984_9NEOP|nr:unnamed protein product [Pieris macdunnoughi]